MLGFYRNAGSGASLCARLLKGGILCALLRSKRAATLPMVAAATIPLLGLIGGGIDLTRAYLVKSRMQQACDAGVLATRKAMPGATLADGDTAYELGERFFNLNLRTNAYGSNGRTFTMSAATDGAVNGTAGANVPTTIMKVFGYTNIPVSATCQAQLNISNNDVLFVLDTTGSMACLPSENASTCTGHMTAFSGLDPNSSIVEVGSPGSSRIDALRSAVEQFTVTLRGATPSTTRLRIGILPYSSQASVGPALAANVPNAFKSTISVTTKVATFGPTREETYPSNITGANCQKYGNNQAFGSYTPVAAVTGVSYAPKSHGSGTNLDTTVPFSSTSNRLCKRNVNYSNGFGFVGWSYETRSFNVASLVAGNAFQIMSLVTDPPLTARTTTAGTWSAQELATKQAAGTASGLTLVDATWDGCILERTGGSYGDDIDTAPTSSDPTTQWTPVWRQVWYTSGGAQLTGLNWNTNNYVCPKTALHLFEVSQANSGLDTVRSFVNVLNDLQTTPSDFLPHGRTYHDIGMVWGARFLSPNGIFSTINQAAPSNGRPVRRHIIFMTDGVMDTNPDTYTTREFDSASNATHTTRFTTACAAARSRGIDVWVIGFAQALTTEMQACGGPGGTSGANAAYSFQANSSTGLNTALQTIAQRIADLRLTQ